MNSRQPRFFTVAEDMEPIIRDIKSLVSLSYYLTGLIDQEKTLKYNSLLDDPNFGIAKCGDWNGLDNFLVMKRNTELNIREIPQRKGGVKFSIGQSINPYSVSLKIGGCYNDKVIVAGMVGTISQTEDSLELYKIFSSKIKKQSRLIDTFCVTKTAEKYLKEDWRLVTIQDLPTGFDLKIKR